MSKLRVSTLICACVIAPVTMRDSMGCASFMPSFPSMPAQLVRQLLALLDRRGSDEDRLAALIALLDVGDQRVPLPFLGRVHEVRVVLANHRSMRGDLRDLELVDLEELLGLGRGRSGHS